MSSAAKKRGSVSAILLEGSLEKLIRNKEIEFYSYERKLDTNLKNFGRYNWNLVKRILRDSGNKIRIQGCALENYLTKGENLYTLASFLTQLWSAGFKRYSDMAFHVCVDIEKLDTHYQRPKEEKLVNLLGETVCDAASWVPEMPYFEKLWNFALDSAVGGMVGYPGYEHPRSDEGFRILVADLAEHYMIGTPQQILRYKKYALESLGNVTRIADEFKNNPESIFEDPYKLHGLEIASSSARIIAGNVAHFSVALESNN